MKTESRLFTALAATFWIWLASAAAAPSHYASIHRDQAFLREGPSYSHRILWVYQRRNYPLKVIAVYDAWRRVQDRDGTTGWMHHTQLSDSRSVLFVARATLHADGAPNSKTLAVALPGVVAKLEACKPDVCEVEISGVDGWVDRKDIWGVDAGEVF